jgi:hypothetical protein
MVQLDKLKINNQQITAIMKKHLIKQKMLVMGLLCFMAAITFSCKDDDDNPPVFSDPELSLVGNEKIEVQRGQAINVTFNLNAEGGNKELVVYRGGGVLEIIPLTPTATTFNYTNQSVPADATEGQEFEYQFELVNTQNRPSNRVSLTVSTLAYPSITIGGETLFAVTIPEDGIVEQDYLFVTGRRYFIERTMDFQSGNTLTIQQGVEVYLKAGNTPITDIIIREGAQADVRGTAQNPVVFTSEKTLTGDPGAGDWGWFNLRGQGPGSNSGTVEYLRMEYGGVRNFRLQNVGNGTTIRYIQVFKTSGEGIMPTDGDVNMRYLVATDCAAGGFRIGDAYSGNIQFGIAMISQTFEDNSEVEIRESSSARLSNFSVIGPGSDAPNTSGIRMRAASSGKVYNSVIASFPRRGLRLNDNIEVTDLNGPTVFAYSFIFDVPTDPYRDDTANGNPFRGFIDSNGEFQNPFFNNVTGLEGNTPTLLSIAGIGPVDFIPDATQASEFDPSSLGSAFVSAPFVGAVENSANDWTIGWVKNPDGSIR